jgi:repressor LexA
MTGDIAVIKRTVFADNGDIVVALVDNDQVTLKKLRKFGQSIALESANPLYKPQIFPPHKVKIQGRLVAMMRSY